MGGWGDNGAARPTTDAYRNSKLWDNIEKAKNEEKTEQDDTKNSKPEKSKKTK